MTVTYLGAGIHIGTSADTKPANVPDNSLFVENDTLSLYIKLSGVWTVFPTVPGSEGITTYTTDTQANETVYSSGASETTSDSTTDTQASNTPTESVTSSYTLV